MRQIQEGFRKDERGTVSKEAKNTATGQATVILNKRSFVQRFRGMGIF